MKDEQFISRVNLAASETGLDPDIIRGAHELGTTEIAAWAQFVEQCVRRGVSLTHPAWKRLAVSSQSGGIFSLTGPSDDNVGDDEDFTLGLRLLMGMLEDSDED